MHRGIEPVTRDPPVGTEGLRPAVPPFRVAGCRRDSVKRTPFRVEPPLRFRGHPSRYFDAKGRSPHPPSSRIASRGFMLPARNAGYIEEMQAIAMTTRSAVPA